jgi:hypothetical protein
MQRGLAAPWHANVSSFVRVSSALVRQLLGSSQARAQRKSALLVDHLMNIAKLFGQARFAKTINHQLRIY